MSEPLPMTSASSRTDGEKSNRGRWLRFLRGVVWFGGLVALISFVGDFFWNVRDHNFGVSGITQDLLLRWLAKALAEGLFFGLFFEFPVWLPLDKLSPPQPDHRDRPCA